MQARTLIHKRPPAFNICELFGGSSKRVYEYLYVVRGFGGWGGGGGGGGAISSQMPAA